MLNIDWNIEAVIVLSLFVLFYWPVWWMCWALVVAAIKILLGLEDMQKIVDANEKLVKELKDGTNTVSK